MIQTASPVQLQQRGFNARRQGAGLLFVLPSLLFILVFFLVPLGMTMFMSLHNWPLLKQSSFTGLQNYSDLVQDRTFWQSLLFTTKYTLLITPVIFVVALGLALLVSQALPFVGVYRTVYFIPVVMGLGAASLLWTWLFNDQVGAFSWILISLHLIKEPVQWLATPTGAMLSIIVMIIWKTVGFTMTLFVVGLQAIPGEFFEAAKIDGASQADQLRYITLPLMRRTFALALILSVIGSFLAFDQFYIMTQGGPQNSTITVVYWIYRASFSYFKLGYGAAMSLVLLVILSAVSVVQLYLLRDDTQY